VVFASGLAGCANGLRKSGRQEDDFFFVQLSDTHWGFKGPPNPEAANTLRQAVQAVNALPRQPDFIVFTGDLTHTTDDEAERHKRMREFKLIVADLKTPVQRYMPGEHDASLDQGKAFQEHFGATHYSFDHKGVHFAVIDNVSDPQAAIGDAQIDWLLSDLKPLPPDAPIVVFTHRPLFDLAPQWDWATKDGSKAIDLLQHWKNVTSSMVTSIKSTTSRPAPLPTTPPSHSSFRSLRRFRSPSARRCPGSGPSAARPGVSRDLRRRIARRVHAQGRLARGTAAVQPAAAIGTY